MENGAGSTYLAKGGSEILSYDEIQPSGTPKDRGYHRGKFVLNTALRDAAMLHTNTKDDSNGLLSRRSFREA